MCSAGSVTINSANNAGSAGRKDHAELSGGWRRRFVFVLIFVALCVGAWIWRDGLLRGTAELWIVSDPITPTDAVVVLGGGEDLRPFVAADLYARGLAKMVLVSEVKESPAVEIGALTSDTEDILKILVKLGVPRSAIETFGKGNKNTWEEAVALKNWAEQNTSSAFVVPTEIFSARRVRWMFRREFAGTGFRVEVPSFDPSRHYTRADWWRNEEGVIAFQNEVLKYLYYRLKY